MPCNNFKRMRPIALLLQRMLYPMCVLANIRPHVPFRKVTTMRPFQDAIPNETTRACCPSRQASSAFSMPSCTVFMHMCMCLPTERGSRAIGTSSKQEPSMPIPLLLPPHSKCTFGTSHPSMTHRLHILKPACQGCTGDRTTSDPLEAWNAIAHEADGGGDA